MSDSNAGAIGMPAKAGAWLFVLWSVLHRCGWLWGAGPICGVAHSQAGLMDRLFVGASGDCGIRWRAGDLVYRCGPHPLWPTGLVQSLIKPK